jgi:hypothetical protein
MLVLPMYTMLHWRPSAQIVIRWPALKRSLALSLEPPPYGSPWRDFVGYKQGGPVGTNQEEFCYVPPITSEVLTTASRKYLGWTILPRKCDEMELGCKPSWEG